MVGRNYPARTWPASQVPDRSSELRLATSLLIGKKTDTPDIAARAVVERYAGMFTSGERKFYETTEQAVRAAARDLVSEFLLSPDDVDQAVKAAIEFIERGGRR
jgi:hypothetical protein